ncbi:MAG: LacI family DNA-binding transcriptional regulator [Oribacterium sp.]
MRKMVKLADIAEKLGVSTVTVSKALSGQKGVSEELRTKIMELADEMGYKQPSVVRRELINARSCNIAVLIHEKYFDKYDSFYLEMYKNLTAQAMAKGSFTFLEIISREAEAGCETPMVIQEDKADGVIILGKFEEDYYASLNGRLKRIPYIYLDASDPMNKVDAVISDSYYGAYYLTNYLFEMGHTEIAYVGTIGATGSITDRYLGYTKSLAAHGQRVNDKWIIEDRIRESGKIVLPEDMKLPKVMPTGFVCNCDVTASVLIKKLEYMGYQVPRDFSVVGYDNYLFPGLCDVELTTYEVDIKDMARKAIDMIIKKVIGEPYRAGINIVEGKLVIRKSVRDLR